MKIVDNLIAMRIVYLLVLPFNKWQAYKLDAIDENGQPLLKIKDMSDDQKANWTMLHRLVARIKRLLGTIPMGKTLIASSLAAYALVRESEEYGAESLDFDKRFGTLVESYQEQLNESSEDFSNIDDAIKTMFALYAMMEDGEVSSAATNTTSNVATYDAPIGSKIARRNQKLFKMKKSDIMDSTKMKQMVEEHGDFIVEEEDTGNFFKVSK